MDIGTAKLPVAERRGITHHLLDVLDVTEPATVAEFQGWAREVIDDCRDEGSFPCAGGRFGALHPRGARRVRVPRAPTPRSANDSRRSSRRSGTRRMHARLAELDPAAAAQVLPSNGRRVVRALEVVEITGRPFSASLPEQRYHYDGRGADRRGHRPGDAGPRASSSASRPMWAAGFVEEVRRLADRGLREGRTANRALGYQQVLAFLDGELTEEEAREQTVTGTRRFARRQDSWFRKDPRITWVRYDDPRARRAGRSRRSGRSVAELVELLGQVAHADQRREQHRQRGEDRRRRPRSRTPYAQPELVRRSRRR